MRCRTGERAKGDGGRCRFSFRSEIGEGTKGKVVDFLWVRVCQVTLLEL